MMVCMNTSVFAEDIGNTSSDDSIVSMKNGEKLDYIKNEAANYIRFSHPEAVNAAVSNPFALGDAGHEAYFLIADNEVLGTMLVFKNKGKYSTTYYDGVDSSVNKAYADGSVIEIGNFDGKICVRNSNLVKGLITKSTTSNSYNCDFSIYDSAKITAELTIPKSLDYTSLVCQWVIPMNNVPNERVYDIWVGEYVPICWAVATAATINYMKGTNLAAGDIYQTCYSLYNNSPSAFSTPPAGWPEWIQAALRSYSVYSSFSNGGLSYNVIYAQLSKNRPIVMDVSGDVSNHTLTMNGISVVLDTSVNRLFGCYYFVDPDAYGQVYGSANHEDLWAIRPAFCPLLHIIAK